MPAVIITLEDTPAGGVSVHSNFVPAVGLACSPAQAAALDIINRTAKEWNGSSGHGVKINVDAEAVRPDKPLKSVPTGGPA